MTQDFDPSSPLGQLQQRARRVPVVLRLFFVLGALGATGYCVAMNTGPYRFLAEAQAGIFDGEHYLAVSFGLTLLLFLLPAVVVLQLLASMFTPKTPPGPPPPPPPYYYGPR